MSRYTSIMILQKALGGKDWCRIKVTNISFVVLLFATILVTLPLLARAGTPSSTTTPAATTASAGTTAPASNTAPPPASEEVPLPQSHVPVFSEVDTNHDGKIEWSEAKAAGVPKKVFDQFDFDHNGSLSETEWLFVRLHMTNFTPPKGTTSSPAAATQ